MLESLQISGLALLKDTTLEFSPALTVISGETGAGKTVLLTSLRLALGGRAEATLVATGHKSTTVDCLASLPSQLLEELEEAGFESEDGELIFSRTVAKEGRSKAAIGGRPVPAKLLAETLGRTVTIHGQADQQRLTASGAQRTLLDEFAGSKHQQLVRQVQLAWEDFLQLRARQDELAQRYDQYLAELEILERTLLELHALEVRPDEDEKLDAAIDRLSNVVALQEDVQNALALLDDEDRGVGDTLGRLVELLRKASDLDPELEPLSRQADALELEAQSLATDLRSYAGDLQDDPDELARLHDRRAALTGLMRGRATTAVELLDWASRAQQRVDTLKSDALDPKAIDQQVQQASAKLEALAGKLTASRKKAAAKLAAKVQSELAGLHLKGAAFSVAVEEAALGKNGADKVTMMLQSHPGIPPAPLSQGASGGELSRVSLALEVALSAGRSQSTFVFDEIDAGLGGHTVGLVAQRLQQLAQSAQVIVVTHQPQIAAVADTNFVVEKQDGVATVRKVSGTQRTDEIVRMLGGDFEAARRHAQELEARARATIER